MDHRRREISSKVSSVGLSEPKRIRGMKTALFSWERWEGGVRCGGWMFVIGVTRTLVNTIGEWALVITSAQNAISLALERRGCPALIAHRRGAPVMLTDVLITHKLCVCLETYVQFIVSSKDQWWGWTVLELLIKLLLGLHEILSTNLDLCFTDKRATYGF